MRVERTETIIVHRVVLKLTAPLALGGAIHRAGVFAEVDEVDAVTMLARNVAVAATAAEVKTAEVISAPRSNTTRMDCD